MSPFESGAFDDAPAPTRNLLDALSGTYTYYTINAAGFSPGMDRRIETDWRHQAQRVEVRNGRIWEVNNDGLLGSRNEARRRRRPSRRDRRPGQQATGQSALRRGRRRPEAPHPRSPRPA